MEPARVDADGARPRFPALDPEPPPKPWWRRLLAPAAVAAAVAVVWAATSFWPLRAGGRPAVTASSPPARVTAQGRILTEDADGYLALFTPAGAHLATLSKLGEFSPPAPAVSADGGRMVSQSGQLVDLSGPRLAASTVNTGLPASYSPVLVSPFTGHDRWLVVKEQRFGSTDTSTQVALVSLATGARKSLGAWHVAVGDPGGLGAFVVKALTVGRSSTGNFASMPDSRMELIDARHQSVLLATIRGLDKILGIRVSARASIAPFPSPSGSAVAVELVHPSPDQADSLVVLSRAGKVLDTVPSTLGPQSDVFWSPSGKSLAFITRAAQGLALTVLTVGGASQTLPFPFTGAGYLRCVWSPDGASILCSDHGGRNWAVAHAAGGPMAAEPGRGYPLAWLR